ncbi:YDG domain-containing protein, partial [Janthinobacterium sp. PC23-8]|uniref:YDG domain-containing protein n=1 Tax=Janthinobacterium sp. PC23-8 TaxID=2012679 RepID=UPI0020CCA905
VSNGTKVYDGTAYAGGANTTTLSNLVAGNVLPGTPVYAGSAAGVVNAGTYAVSVSGYYATGGQSAYAISYIDGGLVITPRLLTLSGATAGNKVYDGTTAATLNAGSVVFNGKIGSDVLTVAGAAAFTDKNVGTGKTVNLSGLSLGGADAANYALQTTTGSAVGDITPKALTVTGITAGNKVYDGTTAATVSTAGATFAGMVNGDSLNATASGAFGDKNAATGKTVNVSGITLGGIDAGNYTLASSTASTTADISRAAINAVTGITAGGKVYDGTATATVNTNGATFAGMVNGDSLNATASGVFTDKNAATGKTVNVSGIALGGADAGNYTLTSNTASTTADISRAAINAVTGITAGSKVYDGTATATV